MTDVPAAVAAGDLSFLDEQSFNEWIVSQRWFASKTRDVAHIAVIDAVPLRTEAPLLALCLVEARFPVGTHETYQVPLGLRPSGDGWSNHVIQEADGWVVYDALADPAAGRELLHRMRANDEFQVGQDEFIFRWAENAAAGLGGTVDVRPVGVEQSNSSIVFGDQLIMKAFRKVEPGVNPELELLRFLSARSFPHIASLAGWYEVEGRQLDATLGILQEFLAGARDGWELALDELASDPEALLDRLEALGTVIGELHTALGSDNADPAFAPDQPSTEALAILTADVDEQIEKVFLDLPDDNEALAPIRGRGQDVREKLNLLSYVSAGGRVIRTHGDLHLGQTMLSDRGWVVLDFEGEPARPLPERRLKRSPLRDVAGMLRSFSYATAGAQLLRGVEAPPGWEERARERFLAGYHHAVDSTLLPPGQQATEQLLAVCLGLGLALSFIASRERDPHWLEWTGTAASVGICLYITIRYEPLSYELAMLPVEGIVGSVILILLVLVATGRTAGATLVGIILVLGAWVFIGPHLPADFRTLAVSPQRLAVYLGLDVNGMIGAILAVAVLIVVPFTLMGQVLSRTGGSAYFADLAMSGMGHFRGGAAKIAVVGSALFGMISGAAVSNVMAVGIVTIPLMARSGFTPTRAAAIEAVGSTGGQLMPPVMGAAAFIMAEFLQVKYAAVALAALLPSLLYYAALFMHVDLEAAKQRIGAAQVQAMPRFLDIVQSGWHFPLPIAFLVATLVWPEVFGIPIERAAVYTTAMIAALSLAFGYRGRRVGLRELGRAVLDTGVAALDIVLIGAAAGLVVGVLSISGISFGLTLQLIALSGDNLVLLMVLTALISIVLGMGMPTVSVYVLTATLLAPSLVKLGVTPMAAHMFVMYYGMLSMITPPVAIAAYAAANIARVPGWQTGWTSVAVGWSAFVIPFLFVLEPSLLMSGPIGGSVWHLARNLLGIFVGTAAVIGFAFRPLGALQRLLFAASALAILVPPDAFAGAAILDWIGLAAAAILLGFEFARSRKA